MDQVPPAYYQWPQFSKYCSCGKRKAVFQRNFINKTKENLEKGLNLEDSRIEAIKSLGIESICCLRDVTLFSKDFICDTTLNAYVDLTINKNGKINGNFRSGNHGSQIGWEFLPKTKGNSGFNQDEYCLMLSKISLSSFDKIAILRKDGSSSQRAIPVFPGYTIVKSENMPSIESDIPTIPNENLTRAFLLN